MRWIFENLGLFVFLFVAIQFVRGIAQVVRRSRGGETAEAEPQPQLDGDEDAEAAERTRRVQEAIRRKIAERRGEAMPESELPPVVEREIVPPMVRPLAVPPLDPFGGPTRRVIVAKERASELREVRAPALRPEDEVATQAVLERQRELAERIQALETARLEQVRRTERIAATIRESTPGPSAAWTELRRDLHDPRVVRRAMVLREILGPPVALR